ncbi:hypothetical protein [Dactylosporangium sp. CA-139066]|uniref:hypothetical protein n=1 Tax=Dactylosporangium sp. CA-139066 TaxID=3239930 RepID=UPI003D9457C5
MASESLPAGGDARRMLGEMRDLALRVRVAQRMTWLPLLVFGVVSFGAIPAGRWGYREMHCRAVADGQVCTGRFWGYMIYWAVALLAAYAVIVVAYARAARARGAGRRPWPYVLTGVGLVVAALGFFFLYRPPAYPDTPSWGAIILAHVIDPAAGIGLALLVLGWLERHVALLVFAVGYLVVALVPVTFGWGEHWGSNWGFAPPLVFSGGMLLLGSLGFGLQRRWSR